MACVCLCVFWRVRAFRCQATKNDLEQRHSQLDDIFTLAQNIKNKTSNLDVRTSITEKRMQKRKEKKNIKKVVHISVSLFMATFFFFLPALSPVERVRSQWDNTQHGVEARLHQLDNMIGHSNHWEERRKEVTALVGHNEGRFHSLLQQSARDPLTKQLADNKVREIPDRIRYPLSEPPQP